MADPNPGWRCSPAQAASSGDTSSTLCWMHPTSVGCSPLPARPLGREHSRLANRIVQFDKLESQLKGQTCHVAFCCLGTTLKQAGSEQAFRQVDFDYVLAFARAARVAQAQRFVVVSSAGANAQSQAFLPARQGRDGSRRSKSCGFPSLDILQPGPLLRLASRVAARGAAGEPS